MNNSGIKKSILRYWRQNIKNNKNIQVYKNLGLPINKINKERIDFLIRVVELFILDKNSDISREIHEKYKNLNYFGEILFNLALKYQYLNSNKKIIKKDYIYSKITNKISLNDSFNILQYYIAFIYVMKGDIDNLNSEETEIFNLLNKIYNVLCNKKIENL